MWPRTNPHQKPRFVACATGALTRARTAARSMFLAGERNPVLRFIPGLNLFDMANALCPDMFRPYAWRAGAGTALRPSPLTSEQESLR
jgi:hypothetical protein